MITLTPRRSYRHSPTAQPRPGWQDQAIPAPHVNAGAAEQGQPGDVLPEDRSAARHHQRASNQVGQTAEHQQSRDAAAVACDEQLRSLATKIRGLTQDHLLRKAPPGRGEESAQPVHRRVRHRSTTAGQQRYFEPGNPLLSHSPLTNNDARPAQAR
jgi:hypothetical protein